MANEFIRKQFAGAAVETATSGSISDIAMTFAVTDGISLPDGTNPFVLVIGRDTATEEKVLCDGRTGNTLSVLQRGYDGTSAIAHASGESVLHILDAHTIDQVNLWANTATVQGAFPVKGAAGVPEEVTPGAANTVLKGTGAAPAFGALEPADLPDNVVETAALADEAVTAPKIAADAVTTAKLLNEAVTAPKIAADAVTTEKLVDQAVTGDKLANGAVAAVHLDDAIISNAKVAADAAIDASKLAGVLESPDGTNWNVLVLTADPVGVPAANEIVFVI